MMKNIKSQYRYVNCISKDGKEHWHVQMNGVGRDKFPTERDAAIAVDKLLISKGKEPINILKRKS
jgi:hypothetical protein